MGMEHKEGISFLKVKQTFTTTGFIGSTETDNVYYCSAENQIRIVVEGVGGGNTIVVQGRIKGATAFDTIVSLVGPISAQDIDISLYDQVRFNCTVYSASGTPTLVFSSFFNKAATSGTGDITNGANVGVGGVGVFDGKVGTILNFRNINALGSNISVTLDNPNNEIDLDVIGTAEQLSYFDSGGSLTNLPGFSRDTTSGGLLENVTENPNNDVGGFQLNNTILNIEPLQNSPDDYWTAQQIQINLDQANSGFSQGTNGNAATVLNLYLNNSGTGNVGALTFITNSFDVGNGTDPVSCKGVGYSFGFGEIHANATIDGQIQGYGFQPTVNAAAIGTSNFSVTAFYDAANIGIPINGHISANFSPTIFEVTNNHNLTSVNINPTVTTLTGNAGVTCLGLFPTVTTIGATGGIQAANFNPNITTMGASAYINGYHLSPTITTMGASSSLTAYSFTSNITTSHGNINGLTITPTISGGDASFTGVNINPSGGATLTNPLGININLGSILGTDPQGVTGIQSDSRISINATTQLMSAQTFQIGSRLEHLFTVPNGSPVTGTDELAVNIAGDFSIEDDVADGAFGIGLNSVGFIASLGVAATKTVDTVTTFLPAAALPDPGFATGGNVTEFHMIRTFPPLPQGGTLNITNLYGFKIDSLFGDFGAAATNSWGLYIDGTCENYIASSIAIGTTTQKVTNTSVALEIGGVTKAVVFTNVTTTEKNALTALPGMQVFDTTLNQMSYYDGTVWVNI